MWYFRLWLLCSKGLHSHGMLYIVGDSYQLHCCFRNFQSMLHDSPVEWKPSGQICSNSNECCCDWGLGYEQHCVRYGDGNRNHNRQSSYIYIHSTKSSPAVSQRRLVEFFHCGSLKACIDVCTDTDPCYVYQTVGFFETNIWHCEILGRLFV